MGRFPTLQLYRAILLIAATLILLLGFASSMGFAGAVSSDCYYSSNCPKNSMVHLATFISTFSVSAGVAFSLLFIVEITKLFLNIENHLYMLRNVDKPVIELRRRKRGEKVADTMKETGRQVAIQVVRGIKQGIDAASKATEKEPKSALLSEPDDIPREKIQPHIQVKSLEEQVKEAYKEGLKKFQEQEYQQAIQYFTKAIELNPQYANAYGYRAKCYESLGEIEKSKRDLSIGRRLRGTQTLTDPSHQNQS